MKKYKKEDIKNLRNRIQNSKCSHTQIKNIIIKHNPKLQITSNRNGTFIYFNDVSEKTYLEIEKYLDKFDKQKVKENIAIQTSSDESTSDNELVTPVKKLKLTNAEQHVLNQVKYKNTISEYTELSENDIFQKKKPIKKSKN